MPGFSLDDMTIEIPAQTTTGGVAPSWKCPVNPCGIGAETAFESPAETKSRLGLDADRSCIMLTEANRFTSPGSDLGMERNGDSLLALAWKEATLSASGWPGRNW